MPMIGWLFILAAFAMIVGSLLLLRDGANMKIPKEKLEKIRQRKAEQDAKDKKEGIAGSARTMNQSTTFESAPARTFRDLTICRMIRHHCPDMD